MRDGGLSWYQNHRFSIRCEETTKDLDGWTIFFDALDEKISRVESAKTLLMHIGSLEQYRDVFSEVGEELGLTTIPRLDEATSFAIQSSSNMNYKKMQELR